MAQGGQGDVPQARSFKEAFDGKIDQLVEALQPQQLVTKLLDKGLITNVDERRILAKSDPYDSSHEILDVLAKRCTDDQFPAFVLALRETRHLRALEILGIQQGNQDVSEEHRNPEDPRTRSPQEDREFDVK